MNSVLNGEGYGVVGDLGGGVVVGDGFHDKRKGTPASVYIITDLEVNLEPFCCKVVKAMLDGMTVKHRTKEIVGELRS